MNSTYLQNASTLLNAAFQKSSKNMNNHWIKVPFVRLCYELLGGVSLWVKMKIYKIMEIAK